MTPVTTQDFLLAAHRAEINTLKHLQLNCDLVIRASELVHELQRERGLSNTYLVSRGQRFVTERDQEVVAEGVAEAAFRQLLKQLDLENSPAGSARLFTSIAFALHCLDELPAFREQISARVLNAMDTTWLFNRLIGGLINLIFEAADISDDPDITRTLVALFNFVQGKEYSGQERAWGVIGFTEGSFSNELKERIKTLQDAQHRCFDIFGSFSPSAAASHMHQLDQAESAVELERMRALITRSRRDEPLPGAMGEVWYSVATARMDGMLVIEQELAEALHQQCAEKIVLAEKALNQHHEQIQGMSQVPEPTLPPLSSPQTQAGNNPVNVAPGFNVKLARSIYDLVQGQAERLQKVNDELNEARQALDERKLIEKAKGLLMANQGINEEQAYRQIRQAAMDGKKRIVEVAANIVSVVSMLQQPGKGDKR